jgi:hypothetical protein
MKTCPFCAEEIQDAAIVCKHCGRELKGFPAPAVTPPLLPAKKKTSPVAIGCLGIIGFLFVLGLIGSMVDTPSTRSSKVNNVASGSDTPTAPAASEPQLALIASNGYESDVGGFHYIEGQVKNLSDKPLENVTAVGIWYDKDGNFIKSDDAVIDYNPILPGQTSPFKTISTGNPAMSRYRVEFKRIFGGTIATRDDRKSK